MSDPSVDGWTAATKTRRITSWVMAMHVVRHDRSVGRFPRYIVHAKRVKSWESPSNAFVATQRLGVGTKSPANCIVHRMMTR